MAQSMSPRVVSRLSRDRDRILPYQLLKLLKEHQVRVRTPEGVWNPVIERDWECLADEFDQAIGELKTMNKRMFRRRAQKAARGEFVGEPVPVGFILPVIGHKPNGQYEYGKYQPYPPHAEIAEHVLREYIRYGGSLIKVMHAVRGLVIPFFPPELNYMERLSALRKCRRLDNGYQISQHMIVGLATNPRLIGVWQWGTSEPITDNHQAAVTEELFLEAFEIANREGKSKGRAATSEPLEWQGLLKCCNHDGARTIVSRCAHGGYYSCELDYRYASGPACWYISARDLDEPLSQAVLGQLELGPCIEDIVSRLEHDASVQRLDQIRDHHEIVRLEKQVTTYKALLPCCVDEVTGKVDRVKEAHYWEQIRAAEQHLQELRNRPVSSEASTQPDYAGVRDFLRKLPVKWRQYSRSSRNRFLRTLIEKVELRGNRDIEATVYRKAGLVQRVLIHRHGTKTLTERLWTEAEEDTLRRLFSFSPKTTVLAALPARTWKSISQKAARMKLERRAVPVANPIESVDSLERPLGIMPGTPNHYARPRRRHPATWKILGLDPLQRASSRGTGEG